MGAFSFNGQGLKQFAKELGKLPGLIKKSEAATLNSIAFKFREEAANAIIGEFVSRRPDFVKRQFRVTKATTANMEAIAGSVGVGNNPAFTGFTEFLGEPDKRERAPTLEGGRGGRAETVLSKLNRLMPGADIPKADEGSYGLPIPAMLSMLHRQGKKRFILGGVEFPPGLYEFTNEETDKGQPKVRMVQSFKKPAQPRRFDWIAAALSKITDTFVTMTHNKNIEREFMKLKKNFK